MTIDQSTTGDRATVVARSARNPRAGRAISLVTQVVAVALALGIWWLGSALLPAGVMPNPLQTLARLGELALTGDFWSAVGITVLTFAAGLAICIGVGVPLGLAIGASSLATQSTRLLFDFLRTIPPIAILPLVLLILGSTFQMSLVLVVAGAIWPILIQSIYAARQGEQLLKEMALAYRVPTGWYLRHIFVPGALPFVLTGVRVGSTICLLLTITAQLLGGAPGVGTEIGNAKSFYDNPTMYAYVLISAVLGLLVNGGFWAMQRALLRWHPSVRREAKP